MKINVKHELHVILSGKYRELVHLFLPALTAFSLKENRKHLELDQPYFRSDKARRVQKLAKIFKFLRFQKE